MAELNGRGGLGRMSGAAAEASGMLLRSVVDRTAASARSHQPEGDAAVLVQVDLEVKSLVLSLYMRGASAVSDSP